MGVQETMWSLFLLLLPIVLSGLTESTQSAVNEDKTSTSSDLWHIHHHLQSNGSTMFNVSINTVRESHFFVERLFEKYGNKNTLDQDALGDLMTHLGLGTGGEETHGYTEDQTADGHCHNHSHNHQDDVGWQTDTHEHDTTLEENAHKHGEGDHSREHGSISSGHPMKSLNGTIEEGNSVHDFNHHRRRRSADDSHVHSTHDKCLDLQELLSAFHLSSHHSLSPEQFTFMCPALVYQLDIHACHGPTAEHEAHSEDHAGHDHEEPSTATKRKFEDINNSPVKVWVFSCVAVLIISLVGLLGVAVVPIMQKVFYNHMLQFLVALAVGALSGDAMLHLLPHSIIATTERKHSHGEEGEEHDHAAAAWKGLAGLAGILFFFIIERLLTIITIIKRNKKSNKQNRKRRCEKYCDIESNKKAVSSRLSNRQNSEDGCDRTVMMVHPNKALKSYADAAHEEFMHQCDEEPVSPIANSSDLNLLRLKTSLTPSEGHPVDDSQEVELMEYTHSGNHVDTREGGNGTHAHSMHEHPMVGHSHGSHGHSHAIPTSVSAVAWMVILGDGIHNFSDGLAIGASFANSITGGFSTSIAVFCHELPHEIGDFAVLLRAGMSAKQAILYNCLSSILCFLGMLIGVAIGNITSASLWIFAVVGGMFMYIALVDMLPEMSSVDPKKGENPFFHLMIQVCGIVLGSSIMLVIALFEHDIKNSLG